MPELPPANLLDIAALVVVGLGAIQGLFRGLSGELSRMISTLLAFVLGVTLCHPVGFWLTENTRVSEPVAAVLAFCLTLAATLVIMILVRAILKRIFQLAVAPGWERLGGLVAGAMRAGIFVIIVFWAMNLWPHEYLNRVFGAESRVGTIVRMAMPHINRMASLIQEMRTHPAEDKPAQTEE